MRLRAPMAALAAVAACWLGLQAATAGAMERPRLRLPATDLSDTGRTRMVTPSDAARIAQQQNGGGKVLAVEPDAAGYRVKLLKNGDVRIVYVPGT